MTVAPTINTQRLTLRHHRFEDFEPMAALFADARSAHMGGPVSRKDLWYWLVSEVGGWTMRGFGSWAIDLKDTNTCVGQIGINQPIHFPEPELGWILYQEFEGKGYAFEAASAARDFAFGTLALSALVSYIAPANARSITLAERLGAVRDDAATPADLGKLVYRHKAPEVLQ